MTTLFWAIEYVKVLLAYGIIFFVWPSIIFHKFLKNKSLSFRIVFCVTEQILLINTVVLMIGLVHGLRGWVIRILFYGPIVYGLIKSFVTNKELGECIKRLSTGTYGLKSFIWGIFAKIRDAIKTFVKRIRILLDGRLIEAILLLVLIVFGMIYFTYGAFQDYSYGFGDMYPHNAWIYGLTQGKIFSAGVYPEGMHCVIYAFHTLFGIRIYSCMLFFQGIHVCMFLFAAYLMLREMFTWKYTPLLVLGLFLTLNMICINQIYGMSRLQWTIPQETSLFTVFLCAMYMIRYANAPAMEKPAEKVRFGLIKRILADENLLMFALAFAVSIVMHFYCTIMAFFVCIGIVPVIAFKIFNPKRLVPFIVATMLGLVVAVIPMAGALASGIPFQGSIGWAMNVMEGTDEEGGGSVVLDENGQEITGNLFSHTEKETVMMEVVGEDGITYLVPVEQEKEVPLTIKERVEIVRSEGYKMLFGDARSKLIIAISFLSVGLFAVLRVLRLLRKKATKNPELNPAKYDHYLSLVLASLIYVVMYCAPYLQIPAIIKDSRLCSVTTMLVFAVVFIPLDFVMGSIGQLFKRNIQGILAFLMLAAIYIGTRATGNFHGYLYYELTRHNGAVMTTYKITEELPHNSYTIVSTVDELYQEIQYGYHEEVVNFVNQCIESDYTLPTEYVFIYVEKNPIEYAQSHFFAGPSWLAEERYTKFYSTLVSQCPEITTAVISEDLAEPPFFVYPLSNVAYSDLPSRMVLESRLNKWCKEFAELYPGELHTYYEDEDFVCYYFKQNPACLYQLGFQSGDEFGKDKYKTEE